MDLLLDSINNKQKGPAEDLSELQPILQSNFPTSTLTLTFHSYCDNKYIIFEGPIDPFFIRYQNRPFVKRHPSKENYYLLRTSPDLRKVYSVFGYQKYRLTIIQKRDEIVLQKAEAVA
jgi:hypothetical protein